MPKAIKAQFLSHSGLRLSLSMMEVEVLNHQDV